MDAQSQESILLKVGQALSPGAFACPFLLIDRRCLTLYLGLRDLGLDSIPAHHRILPDHRVRAQTLWTNVPAVYRPHGLGMHLLAPKLGNLLDHKVLKPPTAAPVLLEQRLSNSSEQFEFRVSSLANLEFSRIIETVV
jgi:hypothetical protein